MTSQPDSETSPKFDRSYWVLPGKLLAGFYPGATNDDTARNKLGILLDAGVRRIINLMESYETDHQGKPFKDYAPLFEHMAEKRGLSVDTLRFPVKDLFVPSHEQMTSILDAIDEAIDSDRPVYVHCWGGVGRTGTVVGCWLIRHAKAKPDTVIDHIGQLREADANKKASPENQTQIDFVKSWQEAPRISADRRDRFLGSLFGLAVGDALGTTLEFKPPGSFEPIKDMVGGGPFGLVSGQWTDDTSMALCLAESLIECGRFNAEDQMGRYVRWWKEGHLSSTGRCFDIGITIKTALSKFEKTGEPFAGSTHPRSAGNGSIMRLAPIPMFYSGNPEMAMKMAAESSKTTHGLEVCQDACRYMAGLIAGALQGKEKDKILSKRFSQVKGYFEEHPLCPEIDAIALGSFKDKNPPEIKGTGYVVASLEAALWAFHNSMDFRGGALLAVNLGNDADTTGAVYGQIAGAFYGSADIPDDWKNRIALKDTIKYFSDGLLNLSVISLENCEKL